MTEELRKDLPAPGSANYLQRVRETLQTYMGKQGNPLDRGLTLRDLVASGLVKLANGYNLANLGAGALPLLPGQNLPGVYQVDLTPPPTPTGFAVDSAISNIFIAHDAPKFTQGHGYLRTKVYGFTRAPGVPLPTFDKAVLITQFSGQIYAHPSNPSTTWHLWIKWETVDGVESVAPAGGTNGLVTTTGADVALLLQALTNKITSSELDSTLRGRVNLVDGTGPGSVAARVAVEAQNRIDAVSAEASARAQQIGVEQNARVQALLDEASARGTAITSVNTLRKDGDDQVARTVTDLTAAVNTNRIDAAAAVRDESSARVDAVGAEANQRTILAARVGAAEGFITTNTAAISSEATTRANAVETLSSQTTSLTASTRTRPNLCPDVDTWTSASGGSVMQDSWGKHRLVFGLANGVHVWTSPALAVQPGANYVVTGDSLMLFNTGGSGAVYFDLIFKDAAGAVLLDGLENPISQGHDYSSNGDQRKIHAVQATAPTGSASMTARYVAESLVNSFALGFRQVKVERGALPATAYSTEQEVASAAAAIKTEAQARIDGDAAEATQRNTLSAQMRGGYSGTDLNSVTTGLLYEERQARATQDQALAQQITLLSAGAGEQFDYKKIFYFDTDAEGWTGAGGALTASGGFLNCPLNLAGSNITSPTALAVDAVKYSQVRLRIRKTGTPTWSGRFWWIRTGDAGFDLNTRSQTVAEPTYDANGIGLITINPTWNGTIDQINLDFTGMQTSTSNFKVDFVALGRPSPGASSAELLDEKTARAAADLAEVTHRETLSSKLTGVADPSTATLGSLATGLLFEERQARSTKDGALAFDINQLTATVGTNASEATAAVVKEAKARVEADSAEATERTTLAARVLTRPNLCPDVDTWTLQAPSSISFDAWGKTIRAINPAAGTYVCSSPTMPCYAGQPYTITGDSLQYASSGAVSFDLIFRNAAGTVLLDGPNGSVFSYHDHSNTNSNRDAHAVSCVAPAGAVEMFARFIAFDFQPGTLTLSAFGFRQVKVEQGGLPATSYTQEAAVQSLNADIVTERTARVNADGALASQVTTLTASGYARPNLCADVDKWTLAPGLSVYPSSPWGKTAVGTSLANGTYINQSPKMDCYGGGLYTVTGDAVRFCSTGSVYFDLLFFNSAGVLVLDGPQKFDTSYHDFSNSNSNRDALAVTAVAPTSAVSMLARFVAEGVTGAQAVGFRQVKVEQGGLPATLYTQEAAVENNSAAVRVEAQARALQTGELYAQYTVKTDVAGLVSGYGLASTGGTSAPSSLFGVRASAFYVAPPATAQATAPTVDLYDGYVWLDTSVVPNVTRYRSGSQWVLSSPRLPFVIQTTPVTIDGVAVPPGVYIDTAFIRDATITRAKIGNAAIDDAKIANLSASKLLAGSIAVGQYIESSSYIPGVQGWRINGNGNAEFSGVTVRGAVFASSGTFAGSLSAATGTFSGSLTASAINAVDTINIAGNAVTVPSATRTDTSYVMSTTPVETLSLTIVVTNCPVVVLATVEFLAGVLENNTFRAHVYRDYGLAGQTLVSLSSVYVPASGAVTLPIVTTDNAPAGARKYSLVLSSNASGSSGAQSMFIQGIKR